MSVDDETGSKDKPAVLVLDAETLAVVFPKNEAPAADLEVADPPKLDGAEEDRGLVPTPDTNLFQHPDDEDGVPLPQVVVPEQRFEYS